MRGSCIACPEDSRNLVLAFSLYILSFNVMVLLCNVDLIDAVMDIIGDLQAFRGIGMMVVGANQGAVVQFYDSLALLTLDFTYERGSAPWAAAVFK